MTEIQRTAVVVARRIDFERQEHVHTVALHLSKYLQQLI